MCATPTEEETRNVTPCLCNADNYWSACSPRVKSRRRGSANDCERLANVDKKSKKTRGETRGLPAREQLWLIETRGLCPCSQMICHPGPLLASPPLTLVHKSFSNLLFLEVFSGRCAASPPPLICIIYPILALIVNNFLSQVLNFASTALHVS
jgi:hypothetical protein